MDQKKIILTAGLLVTAGAMALGAKNMLSGAAAPAVRAVMAAPKGPRVLVAQRALPVGTIITADAIGFQEWPKNMVQDAYFVDGKTVDMSKLLGTVVRYPITAGQPLTQGALVAPGDRGFLAAALGPGMRAITIPVSDKSAVAGFVFPGDHVDLMLTQKVQSNSPDAGQPLNVTETILRNLRVLATDQSPSHESTPDGKTVVHTFRMVTLEVTPRIAEKIEVAQSFGALDMTLRSIADSQADYDKALATGVPGGAQAPAGADKTGDTRLLNDAINHPVEGATSFSTGGDVSRFQRHTQPAQGSRPANGVSGGASGHASHSIGISVVRGNAVSENSVGGSGMASAASNMTNNAANGSKNAASAPDTTTAPGTTAPNTTAPATPGIM